MKGLQMGWLPPSALVLAVLLTGCGRGGDAPPPAEMAKAVEVVAAQSRELALTSELPGRVEPVRVAEVRARVPGIVLSRSFEEGADVKAGQLLFQIDPARFKAELSRARGELAKAEAALLDAQSVVRRYAPLVEIEAVSPQDFDAAQAALQSAQAARQSAQAEVETAQLNLEYASVRAPISGRIGRALVTEGALVGQNEATPLAVIQQLDPVYVDFKQPAADLLRLREALEEGRLARTDGAVPISVSVEGASRPREGRLLFSDVTVDRATGQVSLRGEVPNADGLLLPGLYVRVRIAQGLDPQAVVVPQRAVRRAADGSASVLVVGADGVAEERPVHTGAMAGTEWQIRAGLAAGERVIVGGSAGAGEPVRIVTPAAGGEPR
ncbi:efflux RND transporter periplasmic adaptor subunit [Pseudothauera nasutitermitis]|uniref:Efflux RND transporter periplasmic adaptor subunit n=1 Tax=Pseudothauera nasutitermitis TaxID=2565930 RepID=A0A4S4AWK9_9RHOO|nr:efflux RND transporter periplasmic adaptor subunit [Pseudothauera nasutitermitis]